MPFCACGLVAGAYAFLLLALAVQAENTLNDGSPQRDEEIEALLTNVKVILGGLEAYGVMWSGIEIMAGMLRVSQFMNDPDGRDLGEVKAALEAATRLPHELRSQIETLSSGETTTGSTL